MTFVSKLLEKCKLIHVHDLFFFSTFSVILPTEQPYPQCSYMSQLKKYKLFNLVYTTVTTLIVQKALFPHTSVNPPLNPFTLDNFPKPFMMTFQSQNHVFVLLCLIFHHFLPFLGRGLL